MKARSEEEQKRSAEYQKSSYNEAYSTGSIVTDKKANYRSNWHKKQGDFPGDYFRDCIEKFLDVYKQPIRVFGAGCGRGDEIGKINLNQDFVLSGCDISDVGIKNAHERIKEGMFFVADVTKLPVRDNVIDAVYTSNVIEHVESPEMMLSEIIRILKIGGICVLRGPSYDYWKISIFPKYIYCLVTGKKFDPHGVKFPVLKKGIENQVEFLHDDAMLPRMLPENIIAKIPFLLYPLMFKTFDVVGKILKMLGMHRYVYLNIMVFRRKKYMGGGNKVISEVDKSLLVGG